jgi:hypothetical protein
VSGLIEEITSRLPDRWLASTLAPGAIWLAAAALAVRLGHAHALDAHRARDLARAAADHQGPELLTYGLLVVAGAVLASGAARLLGGGLRELWLGRWPVLADRVTRRRLRRARRRLGGATLPKAYLPHTPTWIGDRVRLAGVRVDAQYGLSLPLIWPRLWQLLDEGSRRLVADARARFESAGTLGGWAPLYALLALLWWPAGLAAAALAVLAWRRGRTAAGVYADTLESTVDIRYRELASTLGHQPPPGPGLPPAIADAINDQLHKGATPQPAQPAQPQPDDRDTELIR